jgi:hypothetical protein
MLCSGAPATVLPSFAIRTLGPTAPPARTSSVNLKRDQVYATRVCRLSSLPCSALREQAFLQDHGAAGFHTGVPRAVGILERALCC